MGDQAQGLRELAVSRPGHGVKEIKRKVRIIAVSSGKGGVGKSNLVVNLGVVFAGMGRQTVVLDGDLGLANINVLMGVIPKKTISNVLRGEKTLKEIIIETPSGLQIIAGASGLSDLADIGTKEKELIISQFDAFNPYDIMIIDTGAGISRNVIDFILCADEVLVVTTPDPTAITDAYGLIKTIAMRNSDIEVKLVVNMVTSAVEGKMTANRIMTIADQFLDIKITNFGFIKADSHVDRSVKEQIPFVEKYRTCPAAQCIRDVAHKILNLQGDVRRESLSDIFKKVLFKAAP